MGGFIGLVETKEFQERSEELLSEEARAALSGHLAQHPHAGAIIPGAGGVRKLRWRYHGKGKRGGIRVIYYFHNLDMPLVLITLYAKAEKSDLTAQEKKQIRRAVPQFVELYLRSRK